MDEIGQITVNTSSGFSLAEVALESSVGPRGKLPQQERREDKSDCVGYVFHQAEQFELCPAAVGSQGRVCGDNSNSTGSAGRSSTHVGQAVA